MKGIILDIDGVLLRGKEVVPGSLEAAGMLHEAGIGICYLTNNSTRRKDVLLDRLVGLGFPPGLVVTSALAASKWILARNGMSKCLVVGERGLSEELIGDGHDVVGAGTGAGIDDLDFLVAGLDREFNYAKLEDALAAVRNGAVFVATNRDPTLPTEGGGVLPGAGAIISAIETCTGVEPVVVGKPESFSTELALNEMELEPGDVLMVGDRPDTDMEAGLRAGCRAAMVLTGDTADPEDGRFEVHADLLTLVKALLR
ncbi:MAG: HAD-IIA family hydrolase [Thermoplasmatota archaeon]